MYKKFSVAICPVFLPLLFALSNAHADQPLRDAAVQTEGVANDIEFQQFFEKCFVPPKAAIGNRFTFHFAIKKDGSVIGRPSVFWLTLEDKPKQRATLEPLLVKALQKCFPVPLEEPFKDIVPGRVHILEFNLDSDFMGIQD